MKIRHAELNNEGIAALRDGDIDTAIEKIREAIANSTSIYQYHKNLSTAYVIKGNYGDALSTLANFKKDSPFDQRILIDLGTLLVFRSRYREALTNLLPLSADNESLRLANNEYNFIIELISSCYEHLGEINASLKVLLDNTPKGSDTLLFKRRAEELKFWNLLPLDKEQGSLSNTSLGAQVRCTSNLLNKPQVNIDLTGSVEEFFLYLPFFTKLKELGFYIIARCNDVTAFIVFSLDQVDRVVYESDDKLLENGFIKPRDIPFYYGKACTDCASYTRNYPLFSPDVLERSRLKRLIRDITGKSGIKALFCILDGYFDTAARVIRFEGLCNEIWDSTTLDDPSCELTSGVIIFKPKGARSQELAIEGPMSLLLCSPNQSTLSYIDLKVPYLSSLSCLFSLASRLVTDMPTLALLGGALNLETHYLTDGLSRSCFKSERLRATHSSIQETMFSLKNLITNEQH
jgi:hypothetical protein